jgi:hypothetical protein
MINEHRNFSVGIYWNYFYVAEIFHGDQTLEHVVGETEDFVTEVLVHLTYYHDTGFNHSDDVFIFRNKTNGCFVYTRMASSRSTAHSSSIFNTSTSLSSLSSAPLQHKMSPFQYLTTVPGEQLYSLTLPGLLQSETCMKIWSLVS